MQTKTSIQENGCWLWLGFKRHDGYGLIWLNGKHQRAHRVAFEHRNGKVDPEAIICHRCDNPSCINPDHMFVGTTADNIRDCVVKKRHAFGERNGHAKLTSAQVAAIRANSIATHQALAEQFGVRQSTVSRIRAGTRRALDGAA
jgi:hypothetical protein